MIPKVAAHLGRGFLHANNHIFIPMALFILTQPLFILLEFLMIMFFCPCSPQALSSACYSSNDRGQVAAIAHERELRGKNNREGSATFFIRWAALVTLIFAFILLGAIILLAKLRRNQMLGISSGTSLTPQRRELEDESRVFADLRPLTHAGPQTFSWRFTLLAVSILGIMLSPPNPIIRISIGSFIILSLNALGAFVASQKDKISGSESRSGEMGEKPEGPEGSGNQDSLPTRSAVGFEPFDWNGPGDRWEALLESATEIEREDRFGSRMVLRSSPSENDWSFEMPLDGADGADGADKDASILVTFVIVPFVAISALGLTLYLDSSSADFIIGTVMFCAALAPWFFVLGWN